MLEGRKKEFIVEFGTTMYATRVFILDIYEHWDKDNEKPEGLITTYYNHNIKRLLIDAKKHITKAQAKRVVECIQNRQARMVISHTGFSFFSSG